jgi:hypothetical protein
MAHTILVNHDQSAIIVEDNPTQYTVTAYVGETATTTWTTDTYAAAERWATIVIAYPADAA